MASLYVDQMGDGVEYVRVTVHKPLSGVTDSTIVLNGTWSGYAQVAYAPIHGPDRHWLFYNDVVMVSAVLSDGREVVLEKHEFTCEDVSVGECSIPMW